MKFSIEQKLDKLDVGIEDGGAYRHVLISEDTEDGLFFDFKSWSNNREHLEFDKFIGRKVRITIETID